MGSKDPAANL
jgi:hypothetical protein